MIDWIAAALSIAGIALNAHKNIRCWPVWIASNVVWVGYAALVGEWAVLATFTAFFAGNVYGWYRWEMDALCVAMTSSLSPFGVHTTVLSERDFGLLLDLIDEDDSELTPGMKDAIRSHNQLIAS
jgi:hypothetical protein